MKIRQLSKRDVRRFISILEMFGIRFSEKIKRGYTVDLKKGSLIFIGDKPALVKFDDIIVPFISLVSESGIKRVYVDEGAVKHIVNGADVMAPGITRFSRFSRGDIVAVLIDKYETPIAIGIALIDSQELVNIRRGKVIKNLHHLTDVFWNYVKGK